MKHRVLCNSLSALPWLLACGVTGFAQLAAAQTVSPGTTPLSDAQAKIFWASPEDAPPEKLGGVTKAQEGRHYVAGNEWNLHLYYETIKNRGGGYVGVGADQAYLFIGWQRPSLAWLMDYDAVIKTVHQAYFALFDAGKTPAGFVELWERSSKKRALSAIDAYYSDDRRARAAARRAWRSYRGRILKRLKALRTKLAGLPTKIPTFLSDQETYDFIVKLIAAKRVRPMVGNLLSYRGLRGIAAAARQLDVPTRAMYVSNAEQYWDYTARYKKNIQSMYVDDKSVFLRTLLTWKRNRDYRYTVQSWKNLLSWLGRKWVRSVNSIVPARKDKGTHAEFLVLARDVSEAEARRRKKGFKP